MKMRIEVDGFEQERAQWKDKQVLYLYHLERFDLIDITHRRSALVTIPDGNALTELRFIGRAITDAIPEEDPRGGDGSESGAEQGRRA